MTDVMEKVIDESKQGTALTMQDDLKNTRKLYMVAR